MKIVTGMKDVTDIKEFVDELKQLPPVLRSRAQEEFYPVEGFEIAKFMYYRRGAGIVFLTLDNAIAIDYSEPRDAVTVEKVNRETLDIFCELNREASK